MDRKIASGLRAKDVISPSEMKRLEGSNADEFAEVYVRKVVPAWISARTTRSAEVADTIFPTYLFEADCR
jgi:hypothetical protein